MSYTLDHPKLESCKLNPNLKSMTKAMFEELFNTRGNAKHTDQGLPGMGRPNEAETQEPARWFGVAPDSGSLIGVEFRLACGNCIWFPYSWLGPCQFNPSAGLLIRFSGDLFYLVLIRGSKLNEPLPGTEIVLASSGVQTHRLGWLRPMNEEEIQQFGESGPIVESICVAAFHSQEEMDAWMEQHNRLFSFCTT